MINWRAMNDDEIREWLATPDDDAEAADYIAHVSEEIQSSWTEAERLKRAQWLSQPAHFSTA